MIGSAEVLAERAAAALALLLLLPLLVLVAVVVRLDSSGPVLFKQVRVGRYGRRFHILKFRTMRVGADAELRQLLAEQNGEMGAYVKLDSDPRITRVGAFLRKTSLDELPQLFNVVRGDMALVGPRPQTPAEIATYDVADWRRLLVRPGITGLWQVSGRSDLRPPRRWSWTDATYRSGRRCSMCACFCARSVSYSLVEGRTERDCGCLVV